MAVTKMSLFQLSDHEAAEMVKKQKIASLITMRDHYDQKALKIREKYQEIGSGSLRPAEEAEDIVDVIDMALRQVEDDGRDYLKRRQNIDALIGTLINETYTKKEVEDLLKKTLEIY